MSGLPLQTERDFPGRIFATENFATVDGPGIRYTVFFQGCGLQCQYCHNPESRFCHKGGNVTTAGAIIDDVLNYKSFMDTSGGGLTLSGGEPLLQPKFARTLLQLARQHGIHTAVDTSGAVPWRLAEPVVREADLVLLDIKAGNEILARRIAHLDLKVLENFIAGLNQLEKKVWIRHVLVSGVNDRRCEIQEIAALARRIDHLQRFELLPFHQMAEDKYEKLGLSYKLKGRPETSQEDIERAKEICVESYPALENLF